MKQLSVIKKTFKGKNSNFKYKGRKNNSKKHLFLALIASSVLLIFSLFQLKLLKTIIYPPKSEELKKVNLSEKKIQASYPESDNYFYLSKKIAVDLSQDPDIKKIDKSHLLIGKTKYKIEINTFTNLCSMDDSMYRCDFQDGKQVNMETLRLWQENKNVFALNPKKIQLENYTINNLVITKDDEDEYFTDNEIKLWKEILANKLVVWSTE
ncbi:MAG: hypothetical protein PVJ09_01775 [Candidatus Woesebacteria bacterium]|jgi:hypothetical protein